MGVFMITERKQNIYAVLTGDLIKSAKLDPVNLKMVIQSIKAGQARFDKEYPGSFIGNADIFSGDSWQVLMGHTHLSFRAVLYFRALVKAVKGLNADTRISLAWGKIDEATVTKVLEAAGAKPDAAKVKAAVAAFDGADIDSIIKEASAMQVAAAPAAVPEAKSGPAKEEKKEKEDSKKSEEEAAAGLGSLFG